jgi:predicted AAA+ superfamily ATPase
LNPVVAILGPRQCGKSTLARHLLAGTSGSVILDLERTSDRNKLRDPEAFFRHNQENLVCLDEIQRVPDLFPVMRSVIDERNRNGQFLVLGSASRDLLRQGSESLAGRVSFVELTPFVLPEVLNETEDCLSRLWLRGGFPRSYLAEDTAASFQWRLDLIRTFLERDIPQLGIRLSADRVERLWRMCAHSHGQLLNYSRLAGSLGVDDHTVRSYLELLSGTFMVRILRPFHSNLKKRLVKSSKLYIRDTGILHAFLGIETHNDLLGHPVYGPSWESLVIETVLAHVRPGVTASFYRSHARAELDLVLQRGGACVAIECKASTAPEVSRGFWNALADTEARRAWVVAPVHEPYPLKENVMVSPLPALLADKGLEQFVLRTETAR